MTAPLISADSRWQQHYNATRSHSDKDIQTKADSVTDNAYQAAAASTPEARTQALETAKSQLEAIKQSSGNKGGGFAGENDPDVVSDLQGLVNVAQYQYDRAQGGSASDLKSDLNAAASALSAVDVTTAAGFQAAADTDQTPEDPASTPTPTGGGGDQPRNESNLSTDVGG